MVAAPVAVGANIAAPAPAKMRVTSAIAKAAIHGFTFLTLTLT
jgi:hypothetical protein